MRVTLFSQIIFFGVLALILSFITPPTLMPDTLFNKASAQNVTTGNVTGSSTTQQNATLTRPGEIAIGALQKLVSTVVNMGKDRPLYQG